MPKYKCKERIKKDDRIYEPGDSIELTIEQAQSIPQVLEGVPWETKKSKGKYLDDLEHLER